MKYLASAALLAFTSLALVGCHDPITADTDVVDPYPNVTFSSQTLSDAVRLNPATVTESATGNMEVSQPIRGLSDDPLHIQYKFVWLDKLGRSVTPEMTWRYKRLEPKVPDFLAASSSSDEVVDYRILLRWSRP
jgi:uncharacterized protein YcfL